MCVVSIAYFDCTQLIALRICTHVGAYNMNIYYIYYLTKLARAWVYAYVVWYVCECVHAVT